MHVKNNEFSKHSIEEGELTLIWSCQDLPNLISVCTDSNGLIYGMTYNWEENKTACVYIISPTGQSTLDINVIGLFFCPKGSMKHYRKEVTVV